MAGNNLTTYLVLIRSYRHFELLARRAVCYFRQGHRGLLVTTEELDPSRLVIVKRQVGNHSKDPELTAWCKTNLLKEARQYNQADPEVRAKMLDLWARTLDGVAAAQRIEEETRLELAKAFRGQPVKLDGRVYYPTTHITKDGRETIQFFENDSKPNLDTV